MLFQKKAKKNFEKRLGGLGLEAFGKKLEAGLEHYNWDSLNDCDASQTIVDDYFHLIKVVHKKGKPAQVELSSEDPGCVIVDGKEYDLCAIPHRDAVNTERRMEIEALLIDCRISLEEIQKRLNEKIQRDW